MDKSDGDEAQEPRQLKIGYVLGLVVLLLGLSNIPLVCLVVIWPEADDLADSPRPARLDHLSGAPDHALRGVLRPARRLDPDAASLP
jgi:hypothetical protein